MSDHFANPPSPGQPSNTPVPNGPLTPGPGPLYGPARHRYGEPPPPTYGPPPATQAGGTAGAWAPPSGTAAPLGSSPTYPGPFGSVAATRAPNDLPSDYARWGRRVPGYLIDFAPGLLGALVLTVAYVLLLIALVRVPIGDGASLPDLRPMITWGVIGGVLVLAGLGWDIYNRWLVGGRTGQSLGKRVMKLRLISEQTGEPIGPLNAFARDLVHILDGLACVGFLWPLWDDKRQTFADMLMHTVVIDERDSEGAPIAASQRRAS